MQGRGNEARVRRATQEPGQVALAKMKLQCKVVVDAAQAGGLPWARGVGRGQNKDHLPLTLDLKEK